MSRPELRATVKAGRKIADDPQRSAVDDYADVGKIVGMHPCVRVSGGEDGLLDPDAVVFEDDFAGALLNFQWAHSGPNRRQTCA